MFYLHQVPEGAASLQRVCGVGPPLNDDEIIKGTRSKLRDSVRSKTKVSDYITSMLRLLESLRVAFPQEGDASVLFRRLAKEVRFRQAYPRFASPQDAHKDFKKRVVDLAEQGVEFFGLERLLATAAARNTPAKVRAE